MPSLVKKFKLHDSGMTDEEIVQALGPNVTLNDERRSFSIPGVTGLVWAASRIGEGILSIGLSKVAIQEAASAFATEVPEPAP